jgi:uncharacterized flavoprotein (TIGR03862 family)
MAAEVLSGRGLAVCVYDQMPSVGRKLVLAGRSGLNLTHSESFADLVGRYGAASSALEPALARFPPEALREWCAGLGIPTFVGSSGRVFPESFRATPLLRAWLARLGDAGVEIRTRHRWTGWDGDGRAIFATPDGPARTDHGPIVLALGGASWPRVGSDGTWTDVVAGAGIEVVPLRPANCGFRVAWSDTFRDRFAGDPLKNLRVSVAGATGPGATNRGEAVVTSRGLEGGAVYAVSAVLRDVAERDGRATLLCDLHPDLDESTVAARLARRRRGESTSTKLRGVGLAPVAVGLLREVTGNRLPSEPDGLASLVKAAPVVVDGPESIDRAISTAGGIALGEVDADLMLRRRPGTFVAGEMLDWEAPTGGYLLQASFSTAVVAAEGAASWLGIDVASPPWSSPTSSRSPRPSSGCGS